MADGQQMDMGEGGGGDMGGMDMGNGGSSCWPKDIMELMMAVEVGR